MKLDIVANSSNDEFYTPFYAVEPLIKYIPKDWMIWCPFDTADSIIAKAFKKQQYLVATTHIKDGYDFFTTDIMADAIISNPPYSLKGDVFERLFNIGKPFAMLVRVVGLFESQKRFRMFKENEFEIMWLSRRVAYFKSYQEQVPSLNPPFSSVWVTKGILPKGNVFEEIYKEHELDI
jgi:hypothetical protein